MWGRTCFALYVAAQQVSRYTTYQIPKFIVFRDVLCVTARAYCPDLSLFSIVSGGSTMVVNLLGCPSGLPECGFRDASGAWDFRGERRCFQGGAESRYCVAAKPHGRRGSSGRRAMRIQRKIGRDRRSGGGPLERLRGRDCNAILSIACVCLCLYR